MNVPREKTAKRLDFEIGCSVSMGLSKGNAGLMGATKDFSPWLRFAISPTGFPNRQDIWLRPKSENGETRHGSFDSRRRLTSEIRGSLCFVTRGLAIIEETSDVPTSTIGTFSHVPAYASADYGHAESYEIEISLNEADFNQIRDLFLRGKPPSGITIWTPDIEYGVAPDGSDKIWEIWESEHATFAKIVGFSMSFSTDIPRVGVGLKKTEDEEEKEREETAKIKEAILHSREDIQLLCYGQSALNSSFSGLRKQIYILIAVAIVIAILIALRL